VGSTIFGARPNAAQAPPPAGNIQSEAGDACQSSTASNASTNTDSNKPDDNPNQGDTSSSQSTGANCSDTQQSNDITNLVNDLHLPK